MTIQIEADQAKAIKAALKEAIPKVSRDPHGDALQQLLDLLSEKGPAELRDGWTRLRKQSTQAAIVNADADEIRQHLKKAR